MRIIVLSIFLLLPMVMNAQRVPGNLVLNGTVFGYTHDDTKSIFKKDKKIELEGSLSDVRLTIKKKSGAVVKTVQSSVGGEFNFNIPANESYVLIYSKKGYGTSAFNIDLKTVPQEVAEWGVILKNIEIILNNYESDKPQDNGEAFGGIYYDQNQEQFEFGVYDFPQRKKLFKKEEENTSINLMKLSLRKNAELNVYSNRSRELISEGNDNKKRNRNRSASGEEEELETLTEMDGFSENYRNANKKMKALSELGVNNETVTAEDITKFGDKIRAERALLEADRKNAVTELDFFNIAAREKLLESSERELANAERYIAEQENKLAAQQKFIYAIVGVLILFIGLAVLLWMVYRQKKKNNVVLAEKNKKIQDSINYALKIQRSVLLSDEQIKALLPNSFVYYQPLDGVSGDFYWFSKVQNKTILAAVDCTGHGVPGAFMSLIGNTLMNQIVNEDHILSPSAILKELHAGIVQSLRQTQNEEAPQDGMDISICALDHDSGRLLMAGAMNAVYLYQNNEIKTLRADLRTIGGFTRKGKSIDFSEQEVEVNKGDRIYLFSDGFMDQFGGGKDEKYNISRFKELIVQMKNVPVAQQESEFKKAHLAWQGQGRQTDDILVIGAEL